MLKNKLDKLFKKIESGLDSYLKVGIGIVVFATVALSTKMYLNSRPNITASTVMITNLVGNSGGSGVVVSVSNSESRVLTNKHVCEVANDGGKVISTNNGQTHLVKSMYKSRLHDLCLIVVSGNLKNHISLATDSPELYSDATVSGHPNLLPNVVSKGHFSGSQIIQVMTGFRPCYEEESSDPKIGLMCAFFGGLPVIKTFEAVLATAMIMPGSSGSAVYNSDNELSGLVFAGSGGMSYAYIVPYEYVYTFLNVELKTLKAQTPSYVLNIKKLLEEQQNRRTRLREIQTKCESNTNPEVDKYCSIILRDIEWGRFK